MKKAHDLSVLCDADVAVIIFSSKGKLFQFASPSMHSVLERYVKYREDSESLDNNDRSDITAETDRLTQYTEKWKTLQRNLIGDDLERLSLKDLMHLEQQIYENLARVRAKKGELLLERLEEIKEKFTDAGQTTNANSCPSEVVTGSGNSCGNSDCAMQHVQEVRQTDVVLELWVDSSDQSNPAGLPVVAKRSKITDDLNRLPQCTE